MAWWTSFGDLIAPGPDIRFPWRNPPRTAPTTTTRFPWRRPRPELALVADAAPAVLLERHRVRHARPLPHWLAWGLVPLTAVSTFAFVTAPVPVLSALGEAVLWGWIALALVRRQARPAERWLPSRNRLQRLWAAVRLRWATPSEVDDVGPGDWVRVRGRVVEGPSFTSASGQPRCVLAFYLGWVGNLRQGDRDSYAQAELYAVPTCTIVVHGEVFEVDLSGAHFLERRSHVDGRLLASGALALRRVALPYGTKVAAQVQYQEVVAVGDEIEVFGHLARRIDRSAAGAYRRPSLKNVLGGEGHRRLLLRKVAGVGASIARS